MGERSSELSVKVDSSFVWGVGFFCSREVASSCLKRMELQPGDGGGYMIANAEAYEVMHLLEEEAFNLGYSRIDPRNEFPGIRTEAIRDMSDMIFMQLCIDPARDTERVAG